MSSVPIIESTEYRKWNDSHTPTKRYTEPLQKPLDPLYKHPTPEKPSGTTICIRNLPANTSNAELRPFVELFGKVEVISVARNIYTGDTRQFGFVRYESKGAARKAARILGDKMVLRGNRLQVSVSNKW